MDNSIQKTTLYRYFDSEGRLLYVGITGDNTKRQSQHRRNSFWFGEIATATFEHFDSRDLADEAETKAINDETPIYNIAKKGIRLIHSPYVHMIHLAGKPDGGHDTLHRDFADKYSELFLSANGNVPDADMVVAFAMQFTKVDLPDSLNLSKCETCIAAYNSEWFAQALRKFRGKW